MPHNLPASENVSDMTAENRPVDNARSGQGRRLKVYAAAPGAD